MQAFTGSPQSPSSPRDLMQVANSRIHNEAIKKEEALMGDGIFRFRQKKDSELIAKILAEPKPPKDMPLMMLPTSSVASRLGGGWYAPPLVNARRTGHGLGTGSLLREVRHASQPFHPIYQRPFKSPSPPGANFPLMYHPKQRMPPFYGRTLHINSTSGVDPRSR